MHEIASPDCLVMKGFPHASCPLIIIEESLRACRQLRQEVASTEPSLAHHIASMSGDQDG